MADISASFLKYRAVSCNLKEESLHLAISASFVLSCAPFCLIYSVSPYIADCFLLSSSSLSLKAVIVLPLTMANV